MLERFWNENPIANLFVVRYKPSRYSVRNRELAYNVLSNSR